MLASTAVEPEITGTLTNDTACCICFVPPPVADAVVVRPCNHLFCRSCLNQALTTKRECPVDRAPIFDGGASVEAANSETLDRVRAVPVVCSSRRHGCTWEGTWGEWCDLRHGYECTFRPVTLCNVPGCAAVTAALGSTATCVAPAPDLHQQSFLYAHVQLLTQALHARDGELRNAAVEIAAMKERLYGLQNDVSALQYQLARDRDAHGATLEAVETTVATLRDDVRALHVPFFVPAVHGVSVAHHHAPSLGAPGGESRDDTISIVWDERCCSRPSVLLEASTKLTHNASGKGWATAFSSTPIVIARGHVSGNASKTRVRFTVERGESDAPFQPSMVMVGVALFRPSSVAATSHAGSLPGCWVLQASGFVWDGDSKLCGQLSPTAVFSTGDTVTIDVESTSDAVSLHCGCGDDRSFGLGASLTWPQGQRSLRLFPVVSLGVPTATVTACVVVADGLLPQRRDAS